MPKELQEEQEIYRTTGKIIGNYRVYTSFKLLESPKEHSKTCVWACGR